MTFGEYNINLSGVVNDLQTGKHGEIMVRMAMTALTMIKKRVQETGVNADGQKYEGYSTKPMFITEKSFVQKDKFKNLVNTKEKRKQLEWRTINGHKLPILKGGYKELRELQTRQTNHVDFSVTNNMWNDINLISSNSEHQQGVAVIGAKQELEKKKLAGNTKRKGDILDLSQSEMDELVKYYNLDVLQIFRNNEL